MDTLFQIDMQRLIERLYPRLNGRYSLLALTIDPDKNDCWRLAVSRVRDGKLEFLGKKEAESADESAESFSDVEEANARVIVQDWKLKYFDRIDENDDLKKQIEALCDETRDFQTQFHSFMNGLFSEEPASPLDSLDAGILIGAPDRRQKNLEYNLSDLPTYGNRVTLVSSVSPWPSLRMIFLEFLLRELLLQTLPQNESEKSTLLYSSVGKYRRLRQLQLFAVAIDRDADEPPSFLKEAIRVMFQKWTDIADCNAYNKNIAYMMDVDSVIHFTARAVTEGRNMPPYTLYHDLSATRYEGSFCYGTVVFAENAEDERGLVSFKNPILFEAENARFIRKLLAMAEAREDDDYALCVRMRPSGTQEVWLNGRFVPVHEFVVAGLIPQSACERCHSVEFNGLTRWTLKNCGHEVISYKEGRFYYSGASFEEEYERLRDFLGKRKEDMGVIREIIETLSKQKDGAMLVILRDREEASDELRRLAKANRGMELEKPVCFQKEGRRFRKRLLLSLSCVDGAIFMNGDFDILGFGVIVDGKAVIGSTTRGSRYNSANTYVHACKKQAAALVLSEDGSIDVLRCDDELKRNGRGITPELKYISRRKDKTPD